MDRVSASAYYPLVSQVPSISLDCRVKDAAYFFGSLCFEPHCKVREYGVRMQLIDHLDPDDEGCKNITEKALYALGMAALGTVGLVTVPLGATLRYLLSTFEEIPYTYYEATHVSPSPVNPNSCSLLSWNICGVSAGYAISDGGVMPIDFRIDRVVHEIGKLGADVNCLYEVFDVITAHQLCKGLEKYGYRYFCYNIGPRSIGVSSGIFVCSRRPIGDLDFHTFMDAAGRAKFSRKGAFSFTVGNQVRICATHLNHSEMPNYPEEEEMTARSHQLDKIQSIMDVYSKSLPQIVTGDYNMDDEEFFKHPFSKEFRLGNFKLKGKKTWGGDAACSRIFYGKQASPACNLDFTVGRYVENLKTRIGFDTFFNPHQIDANAISDHSPLYSTFSLADK